MIQNVIKYFLIIAKDLKKAGKLIDFYIDDLDPRLIVIYIKSLIRERQSEKAYSLLKLSDGKTLSTELQSLFGHLAIIYGDYEIAEECFQRIILDKWPSVDKKSNLLLQSARLLRMNKQGNISLTVQEHLELTKL